MQVEYYLSVENLAKDAYILGQMNAQGFVPLSVIGAFPKVASLTTELAEVVAAMEASEKCSLDATKRLIKPNVKVCARARARLGFALDGRMIVALVGAG